MDSLKDAYQQSHLPENKGLLVVQHYVLNEGDRMNITKNLVTYKPAVIKLTNHINIGSGNIVPH